MPRMKYVIKPWLAGLGSAIVGAAVGALTVGYFMGLFMSYGVQTQALAYGKTHLVVLSSLRTGDTDRATRVLEMLLEGEVLTLGASMEDMPDAQRADTAALFQKVRIHRTQHGVRNKNEELESMLNAFLDQASR
jgi:hypothetical protein